MSVQRKIIHNIILAVLLICTAYFVYSIASDPLGRHDIIPMLAVAAGYIALARDKKKYAAAR